MTRKGVDLSEMNGDVDFQALKKAGVEFVILRCGYGSDYLNQDDKRFSENVRKAETAGIPWGAYLYSYARTTAMAQSEAQHTLRVLNGQKPLYGVWYDVEDSSQAGSDLISICETYCQILEESGLYCGIYSMLSWLQGKLNSSRLDRFDKWVAQWNSTCSYQKPYGLWQYTDRLLIAGKAFDGNYAYKDYPGIIGGMHSAKKEDQSMTEQQIQSLVKQSIEDYFTQLGKKPIPTWAINQVEEVKVLGLMQGDGDGSFRPQSFTTRAELATTLLNLLGSDALRETVAETVRKIIF